MTLMDIYRVLDGITSRMDDALQALEPGDLTRLRLEPLVRMLEEVSQDLLDTAANIVASVAEEEEHPAP